MSTFLKYRRLSPDAFPPFRGSDASAGYDLRSAVDLVVPAGGKALVRTNLQIFLPPGCYGRIAPRSGLALKNFIHVGAGVVDYDYQGDVCVLLFNLGSNDFPVCRGDRIAQLICQKIAYPDLEEIVDENMDDIFVDLFRLFL